MAERFTPTPTPTPGDVATLAHRRDHAPGPPRRAPGWDRAAYEHAVLGSDLHPTARLLAMILASLAQPSGRIPGEQAPSVAELGVMARIPKDRIHTSLVHLALGGWLSRPGAQTRSDVRRPITLTLPPTTRTAPAAR